MSDHENRPPSRGPRSFSRGPLTLDGLDDPVVIEIQRGRLRDGVDKDFNLHRPNAEQQVEMDAVRGGYKWLAHELIDRIPPGRDLSMALTDLETSQRCAIAAIAKNQEQYQ